MVAGTGYRISSLRSSSQAFQSRLFGKEGRAENVRQSSKRVTPPVCFPAAPSERNKLELGFHGVAALPVLALGGRHRQAHLLADGTRQKATHGMRLPARYLPKFGACYT